MAEIICGGVKTSESEFQIVPATSTHPAAQLTAACGPCAAGSAARWASQSLTTPSTLDVYRHMRGLGLGGSDGMSDLDELTKTLRDMGYTVERPGSGETVQQFMDRHAGINAVVWETANGQALHDLISGMGEDATNLQRHILCLFGKKTDTGPSTQAGGKVLPAGYWCADGDNDSQNTKDGTRYHWPINQRLCYYAASNVVEAQPIAALAVLPRVQIPGGSNQVSGGVPQGWKDDGKTLVAPNGVPVIRGMRAYVLAHSWEADNLPLAPEQQLDSIEPGNSHIGPGARQDFRWRSLGCQHHAQDGTWGPVYRIWVGQDVIALTHQLAAANQHISQLEAQIKQLQNAVPPTPQPAPPDPPDPKAVEALAALVELAKALTLVQNLVQTPTVT